MHTAKYEFTSITANTSVEMELNKFQVITNTKSSSFSWSFISLW